jgi:FAD dependent oxidoreductase
MIRFICIAFVLIVSSLGISRAEESTDVLVYGATPGGISAAVSASKAGMKVTLVEQTKRIGGLMSSGLSYSDFRSFESLSGFFLEFAQRVQQHYVETYGADSLQAKGCWRGTIAEPKVNLLIFERMLADSGVRVLKQHGLVRVETSAWQHGRRRLNVTVFREASGIETRISASMFIDGSYEGDLMALAGENYHVGRESREQYGEPMAGDAEGRADGQVQGYNFRLIMTQVESNICLCCPTGRRTSMTLRMHRFGSPCRTSTMATPKATLPLAKPSFNSI